VDEQTETVERKEEVAEARWGECRINPPEVMQMLDRGTFAGAWPMTEAGHWCGKGVGDLDRLAMPSGFTFGEWVSGGQFMFLRAEKKAGECRCESCIFWHEMNGEESHGRQG